MANVETSYSFVIDHEICCARKVFVNMVPGDQHWAHSIQEIVEHCKGRPVEVRLIAESGTSLEDRREAQQLLLRHGIVAKI